MIGKDSLKAIINLMYKIPTRVILFQPITRLQAKNIMEEFLI